LRIDFQRFDGIGPRLHLEESVHQSDAYIGLELDLCGFDSKTEGLVDHLPEIDVGPVECSEPAILEDPHAPGAYQLRSFSRKMFVDHGIDGERTEDCESIETNGFDLSGGRLRKGARPERLGNGTYRSNCASGYHDLAARYGVWHILICHFGFPDVLAIVVVSL
jgi:hypothetical protein